MTRCAIAELRPPAAAQRNAPRSMEKKPLALRSAAMGYLTPPKETGLGLGFPERPRQGLRRGPLAQLIGATFFRELDGCAAIVCGLTCHMLRSTTMDHRNSDGRGTGIGLRAGATDRGGERRSEVLTNRPSHPA
jgi:hypothetical protein